MKVLLVGEFSRLHNNLRQGLRELGVEAVTANFGDSYRKFASDIKLLGIPNVKKYDILRNEYSKYIYHKFMKYDVIQFISEKQICAVQGFEKHLPVALARNAKLSVLLLAGCNYQYSIADSVLPATPCEGCLKYDRKNKYGCEYRYNSEVRKLVYAMQKNVDVMVPMAYEFYVCNQNSEFKEKLSEPIDYPVIIGGKRKPDFNKKLIVYHPLNREGAKGTIMIRKAFQILQKKYEGQVEFIIKGHMPFNEYNKLVKKTDILVIEKCGLSFGMASLMAMEEGKIVIDNNFRQTINCEEYKHVKNAPAFEIGTTVDEIVSNIDRVIKSREQFPEIARRGHEYVSKYHDAKMIARKFLKLYEGKLYDKK